ncbi:UPF0070 protein [Frankliniella fusca]|uniref:UPF0070 protein n=1 Tax=Frankliniella fusca TaxID=407009 RepID=A0AAE1GUR5_9NEOP|nr:UPF0070 protein [Frankliniella fusca]
MPNQLFFNGNSNCSFKSQYHGFKNKSANASGSFYFAEKSISRKTLHWGSYLGLACWHAQGPLVEMKLCHIERIASSCTSDFPAL